MTPNHTDCDELDFLYSCYPTSDTFRVTFHPAQQLLFPVFLFKRIKCFICQYINCLNSQERKNFKLKGNHGQWSYVGMQ